MPRPKLSAVSPLPAPSSRFDGERLADAAESYLKELVLDGPLISGSVVPIDDIAKQLGVSRQPVRDAVNRLASDGLLEVLPQVGCRVARPDATRAADFFRLFGSVEGVVAALAAERRQPDSVEELKSLARARGAASNDGATERRLNRSFYTAMHELAASPELTAIAESFWDRSDFYIRCAFGRFQIGQTARRSHSQIADRIAAGDAKGASEAARSHLERVGVITSEKLAVASNDRG